MMPLAAESSALVPIPRKLSSARFLSLFAMLALHGGLVGAGTFAQDKQNQEKALQEESQDYFNRWLDETVVYIISPPEKSVFEKLNTEEEKEQFIEQFWRRRDDNPLVGGNEFKEEHYRRLAYVAEKFGSGKPGWKTDRGRVYILYGEPAQIEPHPSGGLHERPLSEGGGTTATFPFEVWRYRYIEGEGLGNDIVLEFVDPTYSGEYRLAVSPDEKDALFFVPNAGLTMGERLGMATKADRPFFSPDNRDYPFMRSRAMEMAFSRYETYFNVQQPRPLKFNDLKAFVDVDISFDQLPFQMRTDFFRLSSERVLAAITLQFRNSDLTLVSEAGGRTANVAVYGLVTSMTKRVVAEFDDAITNSFSAEEFETAVSGRSLYQKIIPLDGKGRYKIDLVIKDLNGENVGVLSRGIAPPSYSDEKLESSSLILSDSVRSLEEIPINDQMFVLGDLFVRPSLDNVFAPRGELSVYLQLYNFDVDQVWLAPSVSVIYRLLNHQGEELAAVEDNTADSIHFFSEQRLVLLKRFPVGSLGPGKYKIEVTAQDHVKEESVTMRGDFELKQVARLSP